jgi:two-component system, NarL family, response regulator LiaR
MTEPKKIRLLLIDDHPVLLDSLAHYLAQQGQLEIVGKLSHGDECVGAALKYSPQVVVMDLTMPGLNVIARMQHLLSDAIKPAILILTSDLRHYRLSELVQAGAKGYLPKDADGKQLIAAIIALAQGGMVFHGDTRQLLSAAPECAGKALSKREQELLALMAAGFSNKEIGKKLFLSTGTVKSYSSRLFDKLSVSGRTQAVLHGLKTGLISTANDVSAQSPVTRFGHLAA